MAGNSMGGKRGKRGEMRGGICELWKLYKMNKKIDKNLCNIILHILPNIIYIRGVKVKKPKQTKRGNLYET